MRCLCTHGNCSKVLLLFLSFFLALCMLFNCSWKWGAASGESPPIATVVCTTRTFILFFFFTTMMSLSSSFSDLTWRRHPSDFEWSAFFTNALFFAFHSFYFLLLVISLYYSSCKEANWKEEPATTTNQPWPSIETHWREKEEEEIQLT